MRELELIEKNIIQEMINLDKNNNLNCLSNILEKQSVKFFNCKISFFMEITNQYKIEIFTHDNIDEITPDDLRVFDTYLNKYILLITDLMKYLLENNYIVSTKDRYQSTFIMGRKIEDTETTLLENFMGDDMKGNFINYSRNKYYVTKKLTELVENNYITESEKKYQEQINLTNTQLKYTLIGLIITAISLFISIVFNILQVSNKDVEKIKITNDKIHIKVDNLEKNTSIENETLIKKEIIEQIDKFKKNINLNVECYCDDNLK